jgi:hypothetical protein
VEEGLKTHEVGFNQRIRLEWLERAAALATAGDRTEAKEVLDEAVSSTLSIGQRGETKTRLYQFCSEYGYVHTQSLSRFAMKGC